MNTTKKVVPRKAAVSKSSTARSDLRDLLLGHAPKLNRKTVTLFGCELELQQPTLRAILDAQSEEDTKTRSISMIIDYAYVPGTNERLFEAADREMILNWPFNDELVTIQLAIAELTGVKVNAAEQELLADPLGGQS